MGLKDYVVEATGPLNGLHFGREKVASRPTIVDFPTFVKEQDRALQMPWSANVRWRGGPQGGRAVSGKGRPILPSQSDIPSA